MNKKIVATIVVIVLLTLAAWALIAYAPDIAGLLLQVHTIPQH